MKRFLLVPALVLLACCMSVPKGGAHTAPQATPQTAAALTGDSFTGTIVGHRFLGSMAKPHILAEVKSDDGQTAFFHLRKTTAVTETDGRTVGYMKGFKKGRKVEIKFTVTDGQNEAVSWHYTS